MNEKKRDDWKKDEIEKAIIWAKENIDFPKMNSQFSRKKENKVIFEKFNSSPILINNSLTTKMY